MGKIFRTTAIMAARGSDTGALPNYTIQSEDTRVANYWGEEDPKIFKIHTNGLEKLFKDAKAHKKEVALVVTNIFDPQKVKVRWIVFDGHAKANEDYYVFAEKFYDDGGNSIVQGKRIKSFNKMPYNYVCAIIGKDTVNGEEVHSVFFHPARIKTEVVYERGSGGPDGGGGVETPVT